MSAADKTGLLYRTTFNLQTSAVIVLVTWVGLARPHHDHRPAAAFSVLSDMFPDMSSSVQVCLRHGLVANAYNHAEAQQIVQRVSQDVLQQGLCSVNCTRRESHVDRTSFGDRRVSEYRVGWHGFDVARVRPTHDILPHETSLDPQTVDGHDRCDDLDISRVTKLTADDIQEWWRFSDEPTFATRNATSEFERDRNGRS
jgi:hypothetical protein